MVNLMKFVFMLLSAITIFAFWHLVYMVMGYILCRTDKFHKIGVRFLAMSIFVSGRKVSQSCHMCCRETNCGNWTCENYYHTIL